ncbi:MAG TPA: hypothetical protein VMU90_08040, partial [Solirubrobacteraceae bacterium]|nr:hypothetical protein [Solirubrobacteraceae bacterium]
MLGVATLLALPSLLAPSAAFASGNQVSMFDEDLITSTPGTIAQEMRHLGGGMVRIVVHWSDIAPSSSSSNRPNFNASDPGAYPAANWGPIDRAVQAATSNGLKVLLTPAGHVPQWAFGPGEPSDPSLRPLLGAWKPNASEYGKFVRAVATRYSGHYRGLPRVHAWEIYNEANFGEDLSPQSVGSVYTAAVMYRGMVANAWTGLQASGHRHDTVLLGALAARGQPRPGVIGDTAPLAFVRELYCVDRNYHPFRGGTARQHSCPTSAGAFRRQNPALFNASAFSDHPYPLTNDQTLPPNRTRYGSDDATLPQLPKLERSLDQAVRAWGSGKRYPIWNTEYGYISNPPRVDGVSLANQAYYLNWAEYLSWKDPRVASFMQFLLVDPDPTHGVVRCGGFASGLIFNPALTPTSPGCAPGGVGGAPKPALDAWRLPLYLPSTSTRRGKALEVWGCVRPAEYAVRDTRNAQVGHIQFAAKGSSQYKDLTTVTYHNASGSCYFDRKLTIPSSGTLRLAYTYPVTDLSLKPTLSLQYINPVGPSVSRSISVTV